MAVHGASATAIAWATISRMDGLLLGAVVAIVVRRYPVPDALVKCASVDLRRRIGVLRGLVR